MVPAKPRHAKVNTNGHAQLLTQTCLHGPCPLSPQLDKLQLRLNEEQARTTQLRQDLAAMASQHVKVGSVGAPGVIQEAGYILA